jgi:hypothetical protein
MPGNREAKDRELVVDFKDRVCSKRRGDMQVAGFISGKA